MAKDSIELALSVLEAEKANFSLEQRERLAELVSAGEDVRESVADTLKTEEKREITPEQADQLLGTLKSRFESPKNEKLRKAIDFADVEKSLRANPEKLYALYKLEETGGEPQIVGMEGDEYIIEDRSAESPSGRRNLDFDQSLAKAGEFGVNMQSPGAYKAMQKTGKYDLETGSWLETDPEYRERTGRAMYGRRGVDVVYAFTGTMPFTPSLGPDFGWRASLRVKKA